MKRQRNLIGLALLLLATSARGAAAQDDAAAVAPPAPPTNLTAVDHPLDDGTQIDLTWDLSPDDPEAQPKPAAPSAGAAPSDFAGYKVYRSMTAKEIKDFNEDALAKAKSQAKDAVTKEYLEALGLSAEPDSRDFQKLTAEQIRELRQLRAEAAEAAAAAKQAEIDAEHGRLKYEFVTAAKPGEKELTVDKLSGDEQYAFKVEALTKTGLASAPALSQQTVSPVLQWFDGGRFWLAIIAFVLCFAVVFWINHARQGKPIKVRKIAGLEAVDEAVGRATEMGRPCLFVPGVQDMNDIQTIAGITVLSRVARTAAEYDAKVEVPTSRSLVMTTAREAVQAAFLSAGRPDAYNQDLIYYVTDEQFGYVAYLSGMMVREKPAACFYMGSFFAESLILAETGNGIGAIQIAGTAQPAQLPFFVAACDYTLIGEEFFAASAYLSGSPEELGSLKGQDVGKLIVWVFMAIGVTLFTVAAVTQSEPIMAIVDYIRGTMLT